MKASKVIAAVALSLVSVFASAEEFDRETEAAGLCIAYSAVARDYHDMKSLGASKLHSRTHLMSLNASEQTKKEFVPMINKLYAAPISKMALSNWALEHCVKNVAPNL